MWVYSAQCTGRLPSSVMQRLPESKNPNQSPYIVTNPLQHCTAISWNTLCNIICNIVQYSVQKPPWCTDILILWQTLHYSVSLYCDPGSSPTIALNLAAPAAIGLRERGSNPSSKRQGLPPSIRRNLKKDSKKASHWQVLDRSSVSLLRGSSVA